MSKDVLKTLKRSLKEVEHLLDVFKTSFSNLCSLRLQRKSVSVRVMRGRSVEPYSELFYHKKVLLNVAYKSSDLFISRFRKTFIDERELGIRVPNLLDIRDSKLMNNECSLHANLLSNVIIRF